MRKIIIKFTLLSFILCSALSTTSCENWLNVSPKADMKADDLFSTQEGFRDALIGIYASMSTTDMYGQALTYGYLDVLAQYYNNPMYPTESGYDHRYMHAIYFEYTEKEEEKRINSIWSNHYKTIANANLALQYIDTNKEVFMNEDVCNIYKGELLALRAMLHFNVLRLFASSPIMNNGDGLNSLAIPYIDTYTNLAQPQLTVKEALNKVEADLIAAKICLNKDKELFGGKNAPKEESLPEHFQKRYERMNYWATTALLSRVYLYAGKNSEALAEAKEIIGEANNSAPTGFELTTSAATKGDPMFKSELMFRLDVQKLKTWSEVFFLESSKTTSSILYLSGSGYENVFDGQDLDNDFRSGWFTTAEDGWSQLLVKFKEMTYIPMFKIGELYLIAAETAPEAEGIAYLNKFRSYRGLGQLDQNDDLAWSIYKEYRREFIGEGQLFFFYKRNNFTDIGAEDYVYVSSPEKIYNLPIPTKELDFGNIK